MSRPFVRSILLSLALCSIVLSPLAAIGATKSASPKYVRLFYYQGGALAKKSFFAHPNSIDIFAPQSYALDETGDLSGSVDSDLLAFAKKKKIPVMPLVTNDAFTQSSYTQILYDPGVQEKAIAGLIAEAKKNGYWGWQLDFEQMDLSNRDAFSMFVHNAYTQMHKNGLKFSVAVFAQVSDDPDDYPKNLWQRVIGVYNYAVIAQNADFVSVMSYDDPESTGPVTGYAWLKRVLKYALTYIPPQKLSMGLGLYYWQWDDATGKRVGIGGNEGIDNVFKKYKVTSHYSTAQQAPYLEYTGTGGKKYTLWYENQKSVAAKIALMKANNLYGFSAWALGLEVPSVYNSIRKD